MREVTALCRAKINLALDVLDRRPDGYHNVESVVQSVELADTLRVREVLGSQVEVVADCPEVPSGPANTAYTACVLYSEAVGLSSGIAVSIEKRIPLQTGLGGGSSDAAGALLALNELFDERLSREELQVLAARVGSDVPYFLVGGTALVTGRGDMVRRLPDAPQMAIVIVKPDFGVCTTWAYGRLAEVEWRRSVGGAAAVASALTRGDRAGVVRNLSNDFEEMVAAAFPQIAEIKREMAELGAEGSLLCGSGAGVFGVFPGPEEARRACDAFESIYPFAAAVGIAPAAITIGGGKHGS